MRGYAEVSLLHLLGLLRDGRQPLPERATAFLAVGRISLAVGLHLTSDALRPLLELTVAAIREALLASGCRHLLRLNELQSGPAGLALGQEDK